MSHTTYTSPTRHHPASDGTIIATPDTGPVRSNTTSEAVATPTESGVLSCPDSAASHVMRVAVPIGFGQGALIRKDGGTASDVFETPCPPYARSNAAGGFPTPEGERAMTTSPLASRCAAPITSTPDNTTRLDLTLDGFTDWLLEIHGNTFDAMDTASGDAYRDLLASFARTNSALNLLNEFRAAQVSQEGGAA
jgi:hypothetical protein